MISRIVKGRTEATPEYYNKLNTGKLFSKRKNPTPYEYRYKSNVVYRVNCSGCDGSYIGQTKQHLKDRIYQHKNDCTF